MEKEFLNKIENEGVVLLTTFIKEYGKGESVTEVEKINSLLMNLVNKGKLVWGMQNHYVYYSLPGRSLQ